MNKKEKGYLQNMKKNATSYENGTPFTMGEKLILTMGEKLILNFVAILIAFILFGILYYYYLFTLAQIADAVINICAFFGFLYIFNCVLIKIYLLIKEYIFYN